jgi:hypothetical protein
MNKKWIKIGAICEVAGEGLSLFKIVEINQTYVGLIGLFGDYFHGFESFDNLIHSSRARSAEKDWPIYQGILAKLTKEEQKVLKRIRSY